MKQARNQLNNIREKYTDLLNEYNKLHQASKNTIYRKQSKINHYKELLEYAHDELEHKDNLLTGLTIYSFCITLTLIFCLANLI